jgi:ABC-2 type transport system ATP-binding protein
VNVVESAGLGKRYRRHRAVWALRDCTLAIPAGRVAALVGPNGAGKTTLLHLAAGLAIPTSGEVTVLGALPGSPRALAQVAFVPHDTSLYRALSVSRMIDLAASLNEGFDAGRTRRRASGLGIPLGTAISQLSGGGQQAQLALAIALARHPRLLILDEPYSRLDPLARHDFMGLLMAAVAEDGLSVLLSSHIITELERVADYLVVLAGGRVKLAGDIGEILARHSVLSGPADDVDRVAGSHPVIQSRLGTRQAQLLVRTPPGLQTRSGWEAADPTLEELVLAYLREPSALHGPRPVSLIGTEGLPA